MNRQFKFLSLAVAALSTTFLVEEARPADPVLNSITLGAAVTTDAGKAKGLNISGRAMLVRFADSKTTEAYTIFGGLTANKAYGAHVHSLPCALGGGGHYKNDPSVADTVKANEIWPEIVTGADGVGIGAANVAFLARPEAQSVVLHDADGARIACVDLKPNNVSGFEIKRGQFAPLADPELNVRGSLSMFRSAQGTALFGTVSGLDPKQTYMAHVHNLPCDVMSGGSHYKIDPNNAATVATNELWPEISFVGRRMFLNLQSEHLARPEAQSVVVHNAAGTRVACASLSGNVPAMVTLGNFQQLQAAKDKQINLAGSARMIRSKDGVTSVNVMLSGLSPKTTYGVHVHNRNCASGGGSHYKIDPAVAATDEANEIWPEVTTNRFGLGRGSAEVDHIARPEAQSVVIHDADGSRLGCADLEMK